MTLLVRAATPSDNNAIAAFAAADRDDQFKYFAGKNHNLTFTAVNEDNTVLGLITSWSNSVHPSAQNIRVILNPTLNDATVVLDALVIRERHQLATLAIDKPLIVNFWEPQMRKKTYFEQHGFHVFRKTWMPDLFLQDVADQHTSVSDNIVTLRHVWQQESLKQQVVAFLRSHYEQVHLANPAAHLTIANWTTSIEKELPYLDWSLADIVNDNVQALSFIFPGDTDASLDIGWLTDTDPDASNVANLLTIQLQLFKQTQIKSVFGELDSTDPVAMAVKRKFPWQPAPAWISLINS